VPGPRELQAFSQERGYWSLALAATLALVLGLGCSTITRPPATSTPTPLLSSTTEVFMTPTPSAQATSNPTPMAKFAEPKFEYRVVTPWEELPAGNVVVYEDYGSPGHLLYFGWEGGQGDLLEAPGARSGNADPLPFDNSGSRIAVASQGIEFEQEGQIDVVDLAGGEVRGYRVRCLTGEYILDPLLGPDFLTYQCVRDGERTGYFRFVPLEAPEGSFARSLPAEFPDLWPPQIRWLTNSRIAMTNVASSGREQTACVADLYAWNPMCRRLPYVSGGVSPDGEKVEVREGPWGDPDRVGVVPVSCLWETGGNDCGPEWVEANFQGIQEVRHPGVWSPDSKALYLLYAVHATPKEYRNYTSEVWRFDVEARELARVGRIPNRPDSDDPYFSGLSFRRSLPGIWSPDASEILVVENACSVCSGVSPWHAFSVETGGFRRLIDDAGSVVGVMKKPQPGD